MTTKVKEKPAAPRRAVNFKIRTYKEKREDFVDLKSSIRLGATKKTDRGMLETLSFIGDEGGPIFSFSENIGQALHSFEEDLEHSLDLSNELQSNLETYFRDLIKTYLPNRNRKLENRSSPSMATEQEIWEQKTVSELIELLGQFDTDRRSANIAAAMLEHMRVPRDLKPALRQALGAFISNRMHSRTEQDQVALRCAMRRYVYIQGDAVYGEVERLLRELPSDPPANSVELITAFADFLWIRTPSTMVDSAPALVAALKERCETSLVNHLLAFVDVRVMAIQSLLALILMGHSEAEALIDKAMQLGPARRYLSQRAEDLLAKLTAQRAGSPETRALLDRVLGPGRA
ncbi:MAG: hypothetical protein JJU11_13600 [Candidatus Sumerlaeia bacterium]|nr:hypothetical protein [Candidatus Sumerlaeia bacterium]